MKKRIFVTAAAVVLSVVLIIGVGALAANYGTSEDPLITLSYIRDVLTPKLKSDAEDTIDTVKTELEADLDEKINAISKQLDNSDNALEKSYTYSVVTLQSGQRRTGSIGTELMLSVGTAKCYASGTTGIIDTTDSKTLENGDAMKENHMYMVTINGRGMTATSYVMVLVRGDYTIS